MYKTNLKTIAVTQVVLLLPTMIALRLSYEEGKALCVSGPGLYKLIVASKMIAMRPSPAWAKEKAINRNGYPPTKKVYMIDVTISEKEPSIL